ncbi:MAG: DUF1801 domain-containing protein [Candidatus Kapabacteria bacterium]|nr:DUF1801 domain-containing protein [Candidatus Kapabacteria bacterium]
MAKSTELKTQKTDNDPVEFLNSLSDEKKKSDSYVLFNLFKDISGYEPKMWGAGIVGYGDYRYKYASGREGDWFQLGFSPRKDALTLYCMAHFQYFTEVLSRLGKFKLGTGCLYIKKLEDVDMTVLKELIIAALKKGKEMVKDGKFSL